MQRSEYSNPHQRKQYAVPRDEFSLREITMSKLINRVLHVVLITPCAILAQTHTPSQDAHVVDFTNFGSASSIVVAYGTAPPVLVGLPAVTRSTNGLVQFDLSQLPMGIMSGQVQKATLTL